MFDCSIFTEYTEEELSHMSEKIAKKWRSRLTKEQSKKSKQTSGQSNPQSHVHKVEEQLQREVGQAGKKEEIAPQMDENKAPVSLEFF
jgi:hypothetical protein